MEKEITAFEIYVSRIVYSRIKPEVLRQMGINQRISLRRFADDIRRWVEEGRSDEWIASALGTTPSSVQSFRSRNAIYRKHAPDPLPQRLSEPGDYSLYEGVIEAGERTGLWIDPAVGDEPRWRGSWEAAGHVDLHLLPEKIVLVRRPEGG